MSADCKCCKVCCYSTPYATIFTLSVTLVGLVGFLSSAVYAIIMVSETELFHNHTIILAPIVGGVAGTTFLPLLVATVMAYCVTGYVRDELYHPLVKGCVGGACSIVIMVWTFVYFVLWLLMAVALSLLMALYLQLEWGCPMFPADPNSELTTKCFNYSVDNTSSLGVCITGMDELCLEGKKIGLSLSISLAFSVVIIVGFVAIMLVQSANYISARESSKRSYRPSGNY